MRLLLDSCVYGKAVALLKAAGHDVVWSGDWAKDPGDTEIINIAYSEKRILVTLDKDFGELAIVFGTPHCGIIRLVDISAVLQAGYILRVLQSHETELGLDAIITVETTRIRIRLGRNID